jgi:hypothetical protein
VQRFLDADPEERARLIAWETIHAPGLEPSQRILERLWDRYVAAIASDTCGVEALSPNPDFALHLALLPLLGMPLGELWVLDELARDCGRDGQYAFLLVSVPLNLRGGGRLPATGGGDQVAVDLVFEDLVSSTTTAPASARLLDHTGKRVIADRVRVRGGAGQQPPVMTLPGLSAAPEIIGGWIPRGSLMIAA